MKIGINTNVYLDYSINTIVKNVSEMGYKGIEIARTHPIHEWAEKERKELQELLMTNGLEAYGIQGGTPYTNPLYAKSRIDLACDLECKVVNIGPGLEVKVSNDWGKAWKETANIFLEIIDYAKDRGVVAVIEPEPRLPLSSKRPLLTSYRDVQKMLSDIETKNVGVILDVVHAYVARENLSHIINKLGERIFLIHISDVVDGRNYHFIPGKGTINFEAILKMLKKAGYEGFLSLEVYPYFDEPNRAALESIEYLTNLMYTAGLI